MIRNSGIHDFMDPKMPKREHLHRHPSITTGVQSSGLNLGGIGCGGIELWPDGTFKRPNFLNNRPWAGVDTPNAPPAPLFRPEDLFFVLRIKRAGQPAQMRFLLTGHGLSFTSWKGSSSRTYKYANVPAVLGVEYTGEYPFIGLRYLDESLPVDVQLTAWTSFIPHDEDASAFPGFLLDFSVINRTDQPVEASIVMAASNLAGYDLPENRQDHEIISDESLTFVRMRGGLDSPGHATSGEMSLFAASSKGQQATAVSANPYLENLLLPIHHAGRLDGPLLPNRLEREELLAADEVNDTLRNKGWLCLKQSVPKADAARMRFGLTWYFPNHFDRAGRSAGKHYQNLFYDSVQVGKTLHARSEELFRRSRQFTELILHSSVETPFALSLLDQMNTIARSSWWTRDGFFGIWEGLGHAGINTVDVDHYGSFGLIDLFPRLRSKVLDEIGVAQRSDGHIPHAYACISHHDISPNEYERWDVNAHYALAVYRDWKWTGDKTVLQKHYPRVLKCLDLLGEMDSHHLGLPFTEGGITYDHWRLRGVVTYMAGIYLATLAAVEEMAAHLNDINVVTRVQRSGARSITAFENVLWTGEYYALCFNPEIDEPDRLDTGLHSDALNGDAFCALTALPRLLQRDRVRSTLRLTLQHNRNLDAKFLANGSRSDGSCPDEWPFSQWQNPWTGIEYFFASHLFSEGMEAEGLSVIRDVFQRHCEQGMRFNHVECGEFYSRPLAIFAAYRAWLGFEFDVPRGALRLAPVSKATQVNGLLICPMFWGRFELSTESDHFSCTLEIVDGSALLNSLSFSSKFNVESALVVLNNHEVACSIRAEPTDPNRLHATLTRPITVGPGSQLILHADAPEYSGRPAVSVSRNVVRRSADKAADVTREPLAG
jgi:uncharacterized protein (DUF608 family)